VRNRQLVQRILLAAIVFLASTSSLGPAHARGIQAEPLVVTLEPSSGETVSGVVMLTDAGDDKTNVQVQIVGVEPGTVTMIPAGSKPTLAGCSATRCRGDDPTDDFRPVRDSDRWQAHRLRGKSGHRSRRLGH
jgi:hypothetical protein